MAVDWSWRGIGLAAGYASRPDGSVVNKALLFDGSAWRTTTWPAKAVVLGGAWRPRHDRALLVGESGLAATLDEDGGVEELQTGTKDNLVGPFWRPDGAYALILKGPGDKVYTV